LEDDLKAVVKPQYVDQIPKAVKGPDRTVEQLLNARSQMDNLEKIRDVLGMNYPAWELDRARLTREKSLSKSWIETSTFYPAESFRGLLLALSAFSRRMCKLPSK
jgi:hypothetical protein